MEKILRSNSVISIYLFVIVFLVAISINFLKIVFVFDDYVWSSLFVFYVLLVYFFRFLNKIKWISIYSLFYFTTLIFFGGRFFSVFLGLENVSIFEMNFFNYRVLDDSEKTILMSYVFLILTALEIGLYSANVFIGSKFNLEPVAISFNRYFLFLIIFIVVLFLMLSLPGVVVDVINNGYLALHRGQVEGNNNQLLSKGISILYASLGVFMVQNSKILKNMHLTVFILFTITYLMLGSRGTFVCNVLFLFWLYSDYGRKNVKLSKILISLALLGLFLSSFFTYFSFREIDESGLSVFNSLLMLLYDQGITLMVFNESINVQSYPLLPMIQNFIPGSVFIVSTFSFVPTENISYANFLAYTLDSNLFSKGYGLGWSVYSDFYVLSGGFVFLFGMIVFLFSFFINFMEKMLNRNLYWKVIVISTLPALLFLPRAGLYSYFPLFFYVVLIMFFVKSKYKFS